MQPDKYIFGPTSSSFSSSFIENSKGLTKVKCLKSSSLKSILYAYLLNHIEFP